MLDRDNNSNIPVIQIILCVFSYLKIRYYFFTSKYNTFFPLTNKKFETFSK